MRKGRQSGRTGIFKFDENAKQILAEMFVDMSRDAGEKLSTIGDPGRESKTGNCE